MQEAALLAGMAQKFTFEGLESWLAVTYFCPPTWQEVFHFTLVIFPIEFLRSEFCVSPCHLTRASICVSCKLGAGAGIVIRFGLDSPLTRRLLQEGHNDRDRIKRLNR